MTIALRYSSDVKSTMFSLWCLWTKSGSVEVRGHAVTPTHQCRTTPMQVEESRDGRGDKGVEQVAVWEWEWGLQVTVGENTCDGDQTGVA